MTLLVIDASAAMSARIIYISSAPRSGSTLLDLMLAAHPHVVSIGEAHHLPAYALQDRARYDPAQPLRCSCGTPVSQCAFWQRVQARLGKPLADLRVTPRLLDRGLIQRVQNRLSPRFLLARAIRKLPGLYRVSIVHALLGGTRMGDDSIALFDSIAAETGGRFIVDSSKQPFRFWSLNKARPGSVWLIVLERDYRAVAYSFAKRKPLQRESALAAGVSAWLGRRNQIQVLAKDLPDNRICRVSYEELCDDPERIMRQLCEFLGLEYTASMLVRSTAALHHLGGSPSKLAPDRQVVKLDADYLTELTQPEKEQLDRLVGKRPG